MIEDGIWIKLDGDNWGRLLSAQPQFADKCDWSKFQGGDWAKLLSAQPQFADKCKWSELDGRDWASLLETQPQLLAAATAKKTGANNRLRFEFSARGYESYIKYLPDFDPEDFDAEEIENEIWSSPDHMYLSFGQDDEDLFDLNVYVNDELVYSRESIVNICGYDDYENGEEDGCPIYKDKGLIFKDACDAKYIKPLLGLDCEGFDLFKEAREKKTAIGFITLRIKGPFELSPEGTEIVITGDFDFSKLRLLALENMPEWLMPDDCSSGIAGIEYDGKIYPVWADGDVWGRSGGGIFSSEGEIICNFNDEDEDEDDEDDD